MSRRIPQTCRTLMRRCRREMAEHPNHSMGLLNYGSTLSTLSRASIPPSRKRPPTCSKTRRNSLTTRTRRCGFPRKTSLLAETASRFVLRDETGKFDTRVDTKLGERVPEMRAHGVWRDKETLADLTISEAERDETDKVELPGCQ